MFLKFTCQITEVDKISVKHNVTYEIKGEV